MPTGLNLAGGGFTRRPGVYGRINAEALNQRTLETNVIALVGDWPFIEKATPTSVSSARALQELNPVHEELQLAAKILFNSANDDRVLGGPSRTILVNVKPVTQAEYVFQDGTPADSIGVTSKLWGYTGNQVSAELELSGDTYTFTFAWKGISEEFEFDGLVGLDVHYTGTQADSMDAAYNTTDGLQISYEKASIPLGTYNPSEMAFDGPITITPSAAATGSDTITAVVTGQTVEAGSGATATLTWVAADGTTGKTTTGHTFQSVDSIVFSESGSSTPTFTIAGFAFDLTPGAYPKVSDMVDRINNFSAATFAATSGSPKAASIPSDELDARTSVAIDGGSPVEFNAHCWTIETELSSSSLITVERDGDTPPVAAGPAFLSGGNETTSTGTDWDDAFTSLRTETPQIIWINSTDTAYGQKLRDHCAYMAGEGGSECQGHFGTSGMQTWTQIKAVSARLNSRHLWGLTYQEIDVSDAAGVTVRKGPEWQALTNAAMQAGTAIATPLTRKRPNVIAVYEDSSVGSDENANRNLGFGVSFYTKDRLGLRMERSITTYQIDDNPVWSEGSAVESVNTSIRDIRANLETVIGDPAVATTSGRIRGIVVGRLDAQVALGFIKAFDINSVGVEDLGDTWRVTYTAAPIEPINFIQIEAQVARLPQSA